jgi:uncharacterized OB-fold protein
VLDTGNTYAASTPISLAAILDKATPGQNVLAVSYGSGAYSIATWFKVKDKIEKKRGLTPLVDDYINRKDEVQLNTYFDHIKERMAHAKRLLAYPRIVSVIDGEGEFMETQFCDSCKRIFFPPRNRCIEWKCDSSLTTIKYPRIGVLKEFHLLPFRERFTTNYKIYKENKVLMVDCNFNELKKGMEVELVIRRLDYEGKDGIIQYGPCYRPHFRP